MVFFQVKTLAGVTYIRASEVIAVAFTDRDKCNVIMGGGISLPCSEPASVVSERIEAAILGDTANAASIQASEER